MDGFNHAIKAPNGFSYNDSHTAPQGRAGALSVAMRPLDTIHPVLTSRYLVKGWLDRGAASVVYGESNVGKTFFALDLGLHVAAGMAWHGVKVADTSGPVVYIAGEGGTGINNRIEAVRQSRPDLVDAARGNFMLLPTSLDLCGDGDAAALIEAANDLHSKPSLIVVDTLARTMGDGDENSAKDMGAFIRNVDDMREALGCHVLIVHHSGKDASKGARGSGSLRAAVDTEIELLRDEDITVATTRKQRDMVTGQSFAYTLRGVSIGIDEDGDSVTSAVLEEVSAAPAKASSKRRKRLGGQAKAALQALDDAIEKHGRERRFEHFGSVTFSHVTLDQWKEQARRRIAGDDDGCDKSNAAFRQAWRRVQKELQEAEYIQVSDNCVMRSPAGRDVVTSRDMGVTRHEPNAGCDRDSRDAPPLGGVTHVTSRHGASNDLNPEDWR